MASYKETYKSESSFLKVDDLGKQRRPLTITEVSEEKIGDDKKLALNFKEIDKKLVLNVTNARMMEMLSDSDDTDNWVDLRIILRPDITSYQGKPTPCIRIDSELAPKVAAAPKQEFTGPSDDEIPWL